MSDGDADAEKRVGELIASKYRLLRLLGAGGMGAVYEAEHSFTKRRVAVKLMHEVFAKSEVLAERFIREARAPSAIGHPGIVEVLDGGYDEQGGLYLVLEMLDGMTMAEAYDDLSLQQTIDAAAELLEALGAAHAAGFVHRDIKPDNVFLVREGSEYRVKLLDFGVTGLLEGEQSTQLTKTGTVLGTPMFMSPEQAKGEKVDHRSDLWSVGAILYDALAGHPPYQGDSYNALIVSIVTREHIPLSHLRPDLPPELLEVIARTLRKDPDNRHQSAAEMAAQLRAIPRSAGPSGAPGRRKTPADSTRVDRPGPAKQAKPAKPKYAFGGASTRPSEAIPQPAIVATRPDTMGRPTPETRPGRPAPVIGRPLSTGDRTPAPSSGIGLWMWGGAAMIAIAIGAVVVATMGGTEPAPPSTATAMVAAVADEQRTTAQAVDGRSDPPAHGPDPSAARAEPAAESSAPQPAASNGQAVEAPTSPTVRPLGSADLRAVVAAEQGAIERCYQDILTAAMLAKTELPGALALNITLTVSGAGKVTNVDIEDQPPRKLVACISKQVRAWRFRATDQITKLHFPVVFQPTVITR